MYQQKRDYNRLKRQIDRVHGLFKDGEWRTIAEAAEEFDPPIPENSIQAQLRNLRKGDHGGYEVPCRYRNDTGLSEYRLVPESGPKRPPKIVAHKKKGTTLKDRVEALEAEVEMLRAAQRATLVCPQCETELEFPDAGVMFNGSMSVFQAECPGSTPGARSSTLRE